MNAFQNKKRPEAQNQFPGCMGRMINIFDLSAAMPRNKLLTDRAHGDGSPIRSSWPDAVKKTVDPVEVHTGDRPSINEARKNSPCKKSNGTPMKMLIAQEMSKEIDPRRKPPSVVAKLMGLESLPVQQPLPTAQRSLHEGCPPGEDQDNQQAGVGCFSSPLPCRTNAYAHEKRYKDVYEVWQQPPRINHVKDQPNGRGRSSDSSNERRMALVHQKFMEAKRLATDEKLLQSKEFQDALEVLSSNRDLFLKFLEEPNSLFSKHLNEIQTIPPPAQTNRITVLKPSKAFETKGMDAVKTTQYPAIEEHLQDKHKHRRCSSLDLLKAENLSQATRIVVLKPSPGKPCDFKAVATNKISSANTHEERDLCKDFETDGAIGSREIAKEITRQMRESMNSNRRDDSLLSSVLSNGYIGDESSFNRSDHEFTEEGGGNLSDSEIVTPTSRHSWDYVNRFGSPFSFSSVSRASYSPESSVIREAKKRLSERWALVASHGVSQEQTQVRRSSSTLGEMLAIPEAKKEEESGKWLGATNKSCGGQEDLNASAACLLAGRTKGGDGKGESSLMNLSRSKSVPVSSSTYENIELNVEVSGSPVGKPSTPKDEVKTRSAKSSFKGKVSSLFFSRSKKPSKEKLVRPPSSASCDGRLQSGSTTPASKSDDVLEDACVDLPEEASLNPDQKLSTCSLPSTPVENGSESATSSAKAAPSLEKPSASESSSENQEQPSPVSVLEASFEDDSSIGASQSSQSSHIVHLRKVLTQICTLVCPLILIKPDWLLHSPSTEALSRSPPIESLARSLSWDDTYMEASTPSPLKLLRAAFRADEEEPECFDFVQKLLSSAGFDNRSSKSVFSRWHSLDSPLDKMLLGSFLEQKEEEVKCKERRSNQQLLFDCVNAALQEIGQNAILNAYPWRRAYVGTLKNLPAGVSRAEEVWSVIKEWLSVEGKWLPGEAGNSNVIVDRVVRREVVGREWTELMWWELDEISKEIGGKVLEELVGESLSDFTDVCLR